MEEDPVWTDHYLPVDCPCCGRRRLLYARNTEGHAVKAECEKCGGDGTYIPPLSELQVGVVLAILNKPLAYTKPFSSPEERLALVAAKDTLRRMIEDADRE